MLISHVLLMMFDWIVIDTPQTRLIDAIKLSAKTMFRDGALFTFLMIYVRFWWIFLFFGFFDFYICTAMAYFYYQYCASNPKQPKKEEEKGVEEKKQQILESDDECLSHNEKIQEQKEYIKEKIEGNE